MFEQVAVDQASRSVAVRAIPSRTTNSLVPPSPDSTPHPSVSLPLHNRGENKIAGSIAIERGERVIWRTHTHTHTHARTHTLSLYTGRTSKRGGQGGRKGKR